MLVRYAGVNPKDITGMRAPFLAVGGDTMFRMLNRYGLMYDSSMSVPNPSWPYTLNYKIPHTCAVKPCPTESHPGKWSILFILWGDPLFWPWAATLCSGCSTATGSCTTGPCWCPTRHGPTPSTTRSLILALLSLVLPSWIQVIKGPFFWGFGHISLSCVVAFTQIYSKV